MNLQYHNMFCSPTNPNKNMSPKEIGGNQLAYKAVFQQFLECLRNWFTTITPVSEIYKKVRPQNLYQCCFTQVTKQTPRFMIRKNMLMSCLLTKFM